MPRLLCQLFANCCLGLCAALIGGPILAGSARAQPVWQSYRTMDLDGVVTAHLVLGIAGTDAVTIAANCTALSAGTADAAFYVDVGEREAGADVTLTIATPGIARPLDARIAAAATVADSFGKHVARRIEPGDPVWTVLMDGAAGEIGIDGEAPMAIPLGDSPGAIIPFLSACGGLATAARIAEILTPDPPPPVAPAPADPGDGDGGDAANDEPGSDAANGDGDVVDGTAGGQPADDDGAGASGSAGDGADGAAPADDAAEGDGDGAADQGAAAPPPAIVADTPPSAPVVGGIGMGGRSALPGPLFSTGAAPVPAFSSFRYGIALTPLAADMVVMSTNRTGENDMISWIEVTTERGAGRTVWVNRALLLPSAGGASEYWNWNGIANLVLRAEPKAEAAAVGLIPAHAIGIFDQDQREGNWVRVRFGDVIGWAAHDFLLPLVGGPVAVVPGAVPPGSITPYDATFAAWAVDCDPCRHPDDGTVCRIATRSTATVGPPAGLALYGEGDPDSLGLRARYRPGTALPDPDTTTASLDIAIDGAAAAALAHDDWQMEPEIGTLIIGPRVWGPLLPALKAGDAMTITITDAERNRVDAFDLTGFTAALADMTARLPWQSRAFVDPRCDAGGG